MIYTDGVFIAATTLDELVQFADQYKLKRVCSFNVLVSDYHSKEVIQLMAEQNKANLCTRKRLLEIAEQSAHLREINSIGDIHKAMGIVSSPTDKTPPPTQSETPTD